MKLGLPIGLDQIKIENKFGIFFMKSQLFLNLCFFFSWLRDYLTICVGLDLKKWVSFLKQDSNSNITFGS